MKATIATRVVQVPDASASGLIQEAAELIRAGAIVAFPTETVYGLGACAHNPRAVERIFEAKGRPSNKPLIVHVADIDQARSFTQVFPPIAERLAQAFWPGPLSLVLQRAPDVPDIVCGGGETVAIRAPAHPVALEFIRRVGDGIAAPSANRASRLPPVRASHVLKGLQGRIDMVIDAGFCSGGLESTVVDVRGPEAVILRRGGVSIDAIRALVPVQDLKATKITQAEPNNQAWLVIAAPEQLESLAHAYSKTGRVAVVCLRAMAGLEYRVLSEDPEEYAAQIYDVLHDLEDGGYEHVIAERLPPHSSWAALRDRMERIAIASVAEQ